MAVLGLPPGIDIPPCSWGKARSYVFSEANTRVHQAGQTGAVAACALEARTLFRRGASRAKAGARAADPESRAIETDASGLKRRLHGARGSSRIFVGSDPFPYSRESGLRERGMAWRRGLQTIRATTMPAPRLSASRKFWADGRQPFPYRIMEELLVRTKPLARRIESNGVARGVKRR